MPNNLGHGLRHERPTFKFVAPAQPPREAHSGVGKIKAAPAAKRRTLRVKVKGRRMAKLIESVASKIGASKSATTKS